MLRIEDDTKLDFDNVLIRPKSSKEASRANIELTRTFNKGPHPFTCVPIFASNMDTTGSFAMAKELAKHKWMTCLHKYYSISDLVKFYLNIRSIDINLVWYTLGITDKDQAKLDECVEKVGYCPNLCIDVANGYTDSFVDRVQKIREKYSRVNIMAGNVATPEMVERLIRQGGANIVKIGIGPGSVCETRIKTGVGYPQLSAIAECSDAAHGSSNGLICADGGCNTPGDICKAFGANSDFVMLGGMLSGSDECDGEWEYEYLNPVKYGISYDSEDDQALWNNYVSGDPNQPRRKKRLKFYGMSSYDAQDKYDGHAEYKASEGKTVYIPYKGPVKDIIKEIEGGIRSCCTYIGTNDIKHMGKCTTFIKVHRTHNKIYENNTEGCKNGR